MQATRTNRYPCKVHGCHTVVRSIIQVLREWRWVNLELTAKGNGQKGA
jgi:hypothetical protein